MMTNDPFHESKQAVETVQREYTTTNSLNAVSAYAVVHGCETAVRELYSLAVGAPFPNREFKPSHVPESLITQLGLQPFYSEGSKTFLAGLTGSALQEVRYESTQAYAQYIAPSSAGHAERLVEGLIRFVDETVKLADNPVAMQTIKTSAR